MKNKQLIAIAAVKAGLYSAEEARKILEEDGDFPLHTISGWNKIGNYKIKEGEEGIETKIWRKKQDGGFYLAKAFLYHIDQLDEE